MIQQKRIFFLFLFPLLLCGFAGFAQQITVSGTISDAHDGSPLQDVSIQIKGTRKGTISDAKGHFTLSAKPGAILLFSLTGYGDTTFAASDQFLAVVLSKTVVGLQDVVVVGYGTQSRKTIAGAATTVDAQQIDNRVTDNVSEALEGSVAGLQTLRSSGDPGSGYTLTLRGLSSLSIPAAPLVLIDGVPGAITDVTQEQVQSITVLKDATTAGIYGSSSAGGIILIVTKNGLGRPKFSFDYTVGVNNFYRLPKELKGDDFMRLQNESLVNAGSMPFWTEHQIDSVGAGTDWIKAVTQTGIRHELNLNYSGGSNSLNYLISGNYVHEEGALLTNWYERLQTRFKVNAQATRWLKLGFNLDGSFAHEQGGPSLIGAAEYTPNILLNKGGSPNLSIPGASNYVSDGVNPIQALQDSIRGYSNYNPIYTFNAFFTPEIDFSPHFKFNSIMNAGFQFLYNKDFYPSYTVYDASGSVLLGQRTQGNSEAYANMAYQYNLGIQNYFTFSDTIRKKNEINVVAGNREYKNGMGADVASATYTFPNNLLQNVNNGTTRPYAAGNDYTPTTKLSFYGRATYSFAEKYIAEATLSYDGTDRFGPSHKYGVFPAGALAWVASEEKFLQDVHWLSFLKVRASYGVLGNDGIPQFLYYQTITTANAYAFGTPDFVGAQGAFPTSLANPNIQWENTATLNFGVDATILKMFNVTFDYYSRNTFNMLFDAPVSLTTGFTNEYENIGNLNNKGFEVTLGYQKHWGDWGLHATLNLSHNANRVTRLFNSLQVYSYGATNENAYIVGQPSTLIYGVKVLGIYQNQEQLAKYPRYGAQLGDYIMQLLHGDTVVGSSDFQPIGNSFPAMMAGMQLGLSWKNLDLTASLSGEFGYVIENGLSGDQITNFNFVYSNVNENWLAYYNNRWRGPGTSNTIPALRAGDLINNPQAILSTDLENGNFVRVQNIQVGYTFGHRLATQLKVSSFRASVTVSNPFLFSSFYGFDPETGGYPIMRTVSIGIKAGL